MSDLRTQLIRLAHQKPELRKHLLPLVKVALTVGGKKLLQKVRDEGSVQPIDSTPFQLSKHPIFKSQLRTYLQFLSGNETFRSHLFGNAKWKIQPSTIYVNYFIDNRGLVLQINDPNNKLRAKNTESGAYRIENNWNTKYVAPSLKKTTYAFHHIERVWHPCKIINGERIYTDGPHKGTVNILVRNSGSSLVDFKWLASSGYYVWIPKGKVSVFLLQPKKTQYVVSTLVNIGKSKTIQNLFLGANANQVQQMTKAELKALIRQKFNSFSGLKPNNYGWDFKTFNEGAIHIMDESRRGERLQYSNTVGLFVQTEKSEEYDLRADFDEEEEGMRWDETDEYYQFHQELEDLDNYIEKMLKALFPNREIREGYSDGDDYRHFIYEISL